MTDIKRAGFVILTGPPQHIAHGSCYIAMDGSPTMMSSKAASFNTFAEAEAFAKAHHIALNARTYIGREDLRT